MLLQVLGLATCCCCLLLACEQAVMRYCVCFDFWMKRNIRIASSLKVKTFACRPTENWYPVGKQ